MTLLPKPGICLVSELVEKTRTTHDCDLSCYTETEINLIKTLYDDYLMYIWLHLGDTRFMRRGYQNATSIVEKTLTRTGEI